jgi:hypothetical protein
LRLKADNLAQFAAADQLYVTEFDTVNNIARAVAANHSCEIEFDTVTGTRWKRMKDGRIQYRLVAPAKDGQIWSEPMAPVVTPYGYARHSWSISRKALILPLVLILADIGLVIWMLMQH